MEMNQKKYCHNCGVTLSAIAKFCTEYGTSQSSLGAKPPTQEQEQEERPPQQRRQTPRERIITSFRPMIGGRRDEDDEIQQDRIESISELGLTFAAENFGIEETSEITQPRKRTIKDLWEQEGVLPPAPLRQRDILTSPGSDSRAVIQDLKETGGGLPTPTLAGNVQPETNMRGNRAARE